MKYLEKSFTSGVNSKAYRDNFDEVFGKKDDRVLAVDEEDDVLVPGGEQDGTGDSTDCQEVRRSKL